MVTLQTRMTVRAAALPTYDHITITPCRIKITT
jgi:hypothetical protein